MIHLPFAENYGENHCRVKYSQMTQSPLLLWRDKGKKKKELLINLLFEIRGGAFLM